MPEKPADVEHVQVPWHQNPGKALNDWQQERARKFEEQVAAIPPEPEPPAVYPDNREHHEHHLRGVEWPGAVAQWLWNNQDSTGMHVAKFPLILLSPVVIGPLALVGHLVDEVTDFASVFQAVAADPEALDVTWQPTGSPEPTGDMTGRSVEKEPPYPVPPAPPKRGTL